MRKEKNVKITNKKDEESLLILSRTQKTDTLVSLQTGKDRLEKIEITMTFEKVRFIALCELFDGGSISRR